MSHRNPMNNDLNEIDDKLHVQASEETNINVNDNEDVANPQKDHQVSFFESRSMHNCLFLSFFISFFV